MDPNPDIFKTHPLQKARGQPGPPGLRHFNDTVCKYHNCDQTYTEQSMMLAFAQRVVDEEGEDVTDEWAGESNEHLQETMAKRGRWADLNSRSRAGRQKQLADNSSSKKGCDNDATSMVDAQWVPESSDSSTTEEDEEDEDY